MKSNHFWRFLCRGAKFSPNTWNESLAGNKSWGKTDFPLREIHSTILETPEAYLKTLLLDSDQKWSWKYHWLNHRDLLRSSISMFFLACLSPQQKRCVFKRLPTVPPSVYKAQPAGTSTHLTKHQDPQRDLTSHNQGLTPSYWWVIFSTPADSKYNSQVFDK